MIRFSCCSLTPTSRGTTTGVCVQEGVQLPNGTQVVNVLAHERLEIVDPLNGAQPLYDVSKNIALAVNGEIWNHAELREDPEIKGYPFTTASDCEPIIPLYAKYGDIFITSIDGIFAFVLSDKRTGKFFAARDPIGVMSFYIGYKNDGSIWFASEMKALVDQVDRFEEFPAGHFYSSDSNGFVRWFQPLWTNPSVIPCKKLDLALLRSSLEASVIKRLMTDVP